jgi:hypothetical protein
LIKFQVHFLKLMNKQWGLEVDYFLQKEWDSTSGYVYPTPLHNDIALRREQRAGQNWHAISTDTSKLHQFQDKSSKTWTVIGLSPTITLRPHLVKPK